MRIKKLNMKNSLFISRLVAVLFIIATISYASGSAMIEPFLLNHQGLHPHLLIGAFLELIDVLAILGIGILLFILIKDHNKLVALSYLGTRVGEAVCLIISITAILLGAPDIYVYVFQLAMLGLGLGSLPFCYFLYASRSIPRILSILGFIGYSALSLWAGLEIFGNKASMILFIPGALFEVAFPLWLIVKGLNFDRNSLKIKLAKTST